MPEQAIDRSRRPFVLTMDCLRRPQSPQAFCMTNGNRCIAERPRTGRRAFANIGCLIGLMLVTVILDVFLVGIHWARNRGASPVATLSWGFGSVALFIGVLMIIGCVFGVWTSPRNLRRDFYDSLLGVLAPLIVVVWLLWALGKIVVAVTRFFAIVPS